jgi:hypothetical protein
MKSKPKLNSVARLREQFAGFTQQEQINKCREMEGKARILSSGESLKNREDHLRLAYEWANLAAEMERYYYLPEER